MDASALEDVLVDDSVGEVVEVLPRKHRHHCFDDLGRSSLVGRVFQIHLQSGEAKIHRVALLSEMEASDCGIQVAVRPSQLVRHSS